MLVSYELTKHTYTSISYQACIPCKQLEYCGKLTKINTLIIQSPSIHKLSIVFFYKFF